MKKQKLQTLKGFRDLLPEEKRKRDYIIKKFISEFQKFGFEPLETPTLEYAELLLGKYGKEADKLVYTFKDQGGRKVGLRYDQTVPTARVLAQYRNNLPKFFRRYQIGNVFRAENPQKGRYREITQCDIDIFGTTSPISDAEILSCTYSVFNSIGFPSIEIKLNDRQILFQILDKYSNEETSTLSIIQTIDKLDKKPEKDILKELESKGLSEKLAKKSLKEIKEAKPTKELKDIMETAKALGIPAKSLEFSPTLARGLDYYTNLIFEVTVPDSEIGSLGGGGRYDELISQLGGPKIPAVGMAFGFDRITEVADKLGLIKERTYPADLLVTIFESKFKKKSLKTAKKLRNNNIKVEIYPEPKDSLTKQLSFANKKNIPFVAIIGEKEQKSGKITLKNMQTGKQSKLELQEIASVIKK